MIKLIALCTLLVYIIKFEVSASKFSGPRVYVVTPSPTRKIDEGRSAPFYYHNWVRRMDSAPPAVQNATTTTTTAAPKVKTPDLIFAEFESDRMKNIRKLLAKERVTPKTSTTFAPIYVPDEDRSEESQNVNYGIPPSTSENDEDTKLNTADASDYFTLYNNMYNNQNNQQLPAPVFDPSKVPSTAPAPVTTSKPMTTPAPINNVHNIWHIIDSEKHDQYSGQWDEVPLNSESSQDSSDNVKSQDEKETEQQKVTENEDNVNIYESYALPGFGTTPGNGAENESRAIRTEYPNMRFPYVNLKPFQMKNKKPLLNTYSNGKKGHNMYTSLDSFHDIKNPVRGEAQEVVPMREPIDRYNSAQPYFPRQGSKSKQSYSPPMKAVANLVPPPPPPQPPTPQITADDFPAPVSYESFPPYAPSGPDSAPPAPRPSVASNPISMLQPPPTDSSDSAPSGPDDSNDDNGPPTDTGYNYQPLPPPSSQKFLPTLPPLTKPFGGYSYEKPTATADAPPPLDSDDKPDFQGYHYDKPAPIKPDKPDFHGYHYNKPEPPSPPADHPQSYGPHGDSDYPELIYDKPHGGMSDGKGGSDMKVADDMGMLPPPPPPPDMMKPDMDMPGPPMDDSGFPSDFKYHHGFDDHDFYHHHHHHHTTTTTTTTEMPRVNRYSYYYLGKKLYYLPLYFSVYFIIYVGALVIKAVLRHKIVYPNSWRPNDQTSSFFSKRSVDSWDLSDENLHEVTGKVTHAIATAAEKYMKSKKMKKA